MKKRGFTLAEVMIALALIGVIASLTIPTFISGSRNRANAARLATTISAVENAFASMIASEAVQDLTETEFGSAQTEANLGKYLKLSGSGGNLATYYGTNAPFRTLNRANSQPAVTTIFQGKNGALLIYGAHNIAAAEGHPGSIGRLTIDVNGSAQPNVWGRDVFYFRIGNDGMLYPAGGQRFTAIDPTGAGFSCSGNVRNQGCTAKLIEDNYEVRF